MNELNAAEAGLVAALNALDDLNDIAGHDSAIESLMAEVEAALGKVQRMREKALQDMEAQS